MKSAAVLKESALDLAEYEARVARERADEADEAADDAERRYEKLRAGGLASKEAREEAVAKATAVRSWMDRQLVLGLLDDNQRAAIERLADDLETVS
jgi:multidrug resistance efflux pump